MRRQAGGSRGARARRAPTLSRREVLLLLALALAALAVAVVPGVNTPVARLAAYDGDGPDPLYDARVDAAAIRRAGELVPDGTTYYLYAPGASPLLAGNLKAAAQLFLGPALPARDPALARWVLSYGDGPLLPPGLDAARELRLGERTVLVLVRR